MFMSRVRILAALIAAASASPAVYAQEDAAAETAESKLAASVEFAKALTADASKALLNEQVSEAQRLEDFRVVLADGLALETLGKFMLGDARKTITDEQSARYDAIFPQYITKLYAEQFDEIVGKPLEVIDATETRTGDVIVRTQFERKDDAPIMVDWRIRQLKSGDLKAIDIIVKGISIMLVKREEFSSFIASNGIDALLDRIESEAAV